MAFLTIPELYTHLHEEVIDEISRDDDMPATVAIEAAIEEAAGYLTAYDSNAALTADGSERNPILLLYVKDIAVWHFINLANPNVEMALRENRYEKAIQWFKMVQSGKTNPNLPVATSPLNENGNLENPVKWGGNNKRNNYY